MTFTLLIEQALNGLQFGLMLFLLAAGLTLVFGIMDFMNLAHGSLYMIGAYLAASIAQASGSFWIAVLGAMVATAALGVLLEVALLRRLYARDHLAQVLATFGVLLVADDVVRKLWGPAPLMASAPEALAGPVELLPDLFYPAFRLAVIGVGLAVAVALALLVTRTRIGMRVRAGAANRTMTELMGVRVAPLFTALFAVGAALCALAGAMLGPVLSVEIGMGENILILAFVVVVIGGIGSVRGAFVGALLVGLVDTAGRAFLPLLLAQALPPTVAAAVGPALAAIAIYAAMVVVLLWRPAGLFPAHAG
ncbi:MAG: branched-chain amino acid ABC transporter permease [Burkholderiales bacterium]|jgi:branched-chain amino acid transport system permease protein|nr:branched-chain amino acid ABC transporter permease [Burkholderiales bacterium]